MTQVNLQIPQVGSPDSSEDPKVAADLTQIQQVLNGGLDTSNLSATPGIELTANKGVANGYCDLDSGGHVPAARLGSSLTAPAFLFGDGSDGAGVLDGVATVAGMVPASNVYTMTKDLHFTSLTVNSGRTLITAGFRLFVNGTLTNNGTIHNNGSSGVANPQAGGLGGFYGAGGNGTSSTGVATTDSLGGSGGGSGTNAGGTATAATAANGGVPRDVVSMISRVRTYAGGGGGGGSSGSNGGGGGGVVAALAKVIVNAGAIQARGGAGAGTNAGGGGGGGVFLSYQTLSGAGTIDANGGAGVGTGTAGSNGTVIQVAAT